MQQCSSSVHIANSLQLNSNSINLQFLYRWVKLGQKLLNISGILSLQKPAKYSAGYITFGAAPIV